MRRLEHNNLRIKKSKCEFFKDSVEYLGHSVDAQGLHTLPSKVEAILKAPDPRNLQQLRSFLGLLNYYGKFIPNLASIVHPLNHLLQKDVKWAWTSDCAQTFAAAKEVLNSSQVLAHYDPTLPIAMAGDASAYGIGSVISHVLPDGSERPIPYQLVRRITVNWRRRLCHWCLVLRSFTNTCMDISSHSIQITSHCYQSLDLRRVYPLGCNKASTLGCWAILLSAYNYDIQFKSTSTHANADGLSRLPISDTMTADQSVEVSLFNVAQINSLPVTANRQTHQI